MSPSYYYFLTYKLTDKFQSRDMFDGRLAKFGLTEKQSPASCTEPDIGRDRLITDGQHELRVEVELDGSVEYVKYDWNILGSRGEYPDILEKLVNALKTEAVRICEATEDDLQLLFYCSRAGIDTGFDWDPDDPRRYEKWMAWKRDGGYAKAEAAERAHAEKHAPPRNPP
jgi:hypothetical protein